MMFPLEQQMMHIDPWPPQESGDLALRHFQLLPGVATEEHLRLTHRLAPPLPAGDVGGRNLIGGGDLLEKSLQIRRVIHLCSFLYHQTYHSFPMNKAAPTCLPPAKP